MRRLLIAGSVVTATLLAGCSTPSVMYYTLSPAASAVPATGQPVWTHPYRVGSVNVPAQVDDTSLVVRQSADQMMVLTYDRWSSTLDEQFRDALTQALTLQLGMPPVQNLASGVAQRSTSQITVDVQRFELLPGKEAILAAIWRISPLPAVAVQKGKPATEMTCYSMLHSPSDVGVVAMVAAQQRNLVTLSEQIAQALKTGKAVATQTAPAPNCY